MTQVFIQGRVPDDDIEALGLENVEVSVEDDEEEPDGTPQVAVEEDDLPPVGSRVTVHNPNEEADPWTGVIDSIDGDTATVKADEDGELYDEPHGCCVLTEEPEAEEAEPEGPDWEVGQAVSVDHDGEQWDGEIAELYDDDTADVLYAEDGETYNIPFTALTAADGGNEEPPADDTTAEDEDGVPWVPAVGDTYVYDGVEIKVTEVDEDSKQVTGEDEENVYSEIPWDELEFVAQD
jgi:hypothetical protein